MTNPRPATTGPAASLAARTARTLAATLAICAILLGLATVPAVAAPSLGVELTRDDESFFPTVYRDDKRVDYTVRVTNTAPSSTTVGAQITCDPNAAGWFNSPSSFTYQWVRDGVSLGSANGAQTAAYTVQPADAGQTLQCTVHASNADGASLSFTNPFVVDPPPTIPPPGWSPQSDPRPTVTGDLAEQRTCTAPTTWTGAPSFAYQWLRNGEPIPGATSPTYIPQFGAGQPDELKVLQCQVAGTNAGGAAIAVSHNDDNSTWSGIAPSNRVASSGDPRPFIALNRTSGAVVVEVELPGGLGTHVKDTFTIDSQTDVTWSCSAQPAVGVQAAKAVCSRSDVLPPGGAYDPFVVGVALGADAPDTAVATATVSGGGAVDPASDVYQFDFAPFRGFGIEAFETSVLDEAGDPYTQAGGHPHSVSTHFAFNGMRDFFGVGVRPVEHQVRIIDAGKTIVVDAPAGFVGNARALDALCSSTAEVIANTCPLESVVGEIDLRFDFGDAYFGAPIYAIEPEFGRPAQFAFTHTGSAGVYVFYPRLRPDDRYALSFESAPLHTERPKLIGADVRLCGVGVEVNVSLDGTRFVEECRQPGEEEANPKPLVTLPPRCGVTPPTSVISADSWQNQGVFKSRSFVDPPLTGCDLVRFDPEVEFRPTATGADAASGLDVELSMPADGLEDPEGVSQAHLKKSVVELPKGMSINPSAATALEGCSDGQLGLGTDSEPLCPDGSKIASVDVTTPVLEETLGGVMVLRTPESTDPMSGEMFRMALIVRNDERGLLIKLPGSATADPQTGKVTATFDETPELPIGTVKVRVKGGDRGVLAMPQDCGQESIATELSPWKGAANTLANAQTFSDGFTVGGDCSNGFAPGLDAGMDTQTARANGKFSFRFTRRDGEQWLRGLTAKLPKGLLASVKDLPLCSNAQADAGSCPAVSRIGAVDAKAGSGDPFVLEQKGDVFLTEGYKGGPYGLAVKIRPVAGPFRGEHELSPIIVRQAIHVDRTTARVTAVSDPFPLIHHGVPLRTREVTVLVDRDRFMLNPSGCVAKQVGADILSAEGTTAGVTNHFQVVNCATLPFRPRLALRLTGRKQTRTGKHPGVRAKVTQKGIGEAGIEKAVVRLPKSLALDVDNAQALCEFADGTKPDLENHCPRGSIVGRARAVSPLLNDPLVGNVYFVKNVRKDARTGNAIRTLPMIVVALRGEIAVNLKGKSSTTKSGKLVNTFAEVPDAPVSRFNLNINGGKTGILAVTRTRRALIDLCAGRHVAEADMDGHNGRRSDRNIRLKTPCAKSGKKKSGRARGRARR